MSSVVVTVVSAAELRIPPGVPITPYVEIEYAQARRTTTTAKESLEPVWMESFAFETVEGEDEMVFKVFLPGGLFIGKALLSFAKFGTDADLCFELGDEDNEVGGKLVVKVEPKTPKSPVEAPAQAPVAHADAISQSASVLGPKTRLSITNAQMVDTDNFVCILRVGAVQKICDVTGAEEYLFSIQPEDDVQIEVHSGGQTYGFAKLKGSAVLSRSGSNCWIVVSNSIGHHVGKVLLTISSVTPVESLSGPLDSRGCDTTELTIIVVSAEELPRPCDACVYLSIGDNDRATTKKTSTKEPQWNEKFVFYVEEGDTLSAKVFDNEDFVAEAIVPVTELLYVADMRRQLEVKLLDRKRRNAGLLVLGAEVALPPVPPAAASPVSRTVFAAEGPHRPSVPLTQTSSVVAQAPIAVAVVAQTPTATNVTQTPLAVGAAAVPPLEAPPGVQVIRRVVRVPVGTSVNDALAQAAPQVPNAGYPISRMPVNQCQTSSSSNIVMTKRPVSNLTAGFPSQRSTLPVTTTVSASDYPVRRVVPASQTQRLDTVVNATVPLSVSPFALNSAAGQSGFHDAVVMPPSGSGIYEPSIPGAITRYAGRVRLGQSLDTVLMTSSGRTASGVSPFAVPVASPITYVAAASSLSVCGTGAQRPIVRTVRA